MAEVRTGAGPVDQRVGTRLQMRRELLGVSEEILSKRLGCARALIQDYEAGRARVGASTLMQLTLALEVDVSYFLEGLLDDPPPATLVERGARDTLDS